VRAERAAKRRIHRDLLADVRRADQIEAEAAVRGRDLEAKQIELRRFPHQLTREIPVVFVETLDDGQHFLVHELGGGLAEQALFFREILADEDVIGTCVGRQELSASERHVRLGHQLTLIEGGKYKPDIVPTINELFSLRDRVAIVTGGSRGLGQEMAEGLAEAGASLMLCARREQWLTPTVEAMRGKGFHVEGMLCDVSKADDVQAVVDETMATFGRIDILINNAGVTWAAEPEQLPLAKWQKVVDVNLTGAFLFAQAAGREMLKQRYGRIINVASIAGLHASVHGPHFAPYAATKAGLIGLTRELAASWGRQNIRVNAIAPGYFHSRLADGAIEMSEPAIKATSPIPRVGEAGELKGVAVFLAADASNYITGQTIVVDGGRTIA